MTIILTLSHCITLTTNNSITYLNLLADLSDSVFLS